MATTHVQIIRDKGGTAAFGLALGVKPKTAQMWLFRKRIPRSVWPEVVETFPDLTVEVLKEAEPPR